MKKSFAFIIICLALGACQTIPQARDIKKKPRSGGIIGLPLNPSAEDRKKADDLMQQNCSPLMVSVEDEGEAVIGQQTKSTGNETNVDDTRRSQGQFLGMNLMSGSNSGKETSQSSTTTQLKEWQISYACLSEEKTQKKKTH